MYIKKWKVGAIFEFWRVRMKDKRWGDKITSHSITRDYDDVISRNQIWGSKMAVLKLALLGEQEYPFRQVERVLRPVSSLHYWTSTSTVTWDHSIIQRLLWSRNSRLYPQGFKYVLATSYTYTARINVLNLKYIWPLDLSCWVVSLYFTRDTPDSSLYRSLFTLNNLHYGGNS